MLDKKPLLFVSHRVGNFGGVMAEYSEDKLRCLEQSGTPTYVVTSLDSTPIARNNLHFYRVPSFSYIELKEQFHLLRIRKLSIPVQGYLMYPIAFAFGSIFDLILRRKFAASHGGFWGWGLTAVPVAFSVLIIKRAKVIFSTGSAAAGLIGALLKKITRTPFYYEVPDPVVGVTMSYSTARLSRIESLEQFLIRNSTRTVFVTKFAALRARERCPSLARRITTIYPGSWDFQTKVNHRDGDLISIVHLGSLYGTRNLNVFLESLQELTKLPEFARQKFKVINIGGVDSQLPEINNPHIEVQILPEVRRQDALEYGASASILLLLQHDDARSLETIPYKFYDYLNLCVPIIGLVENNEIAEILKGSTAFLAPVNSSELTKVAISDCLRTVLSGQQPVYHRFDITNQFHKIFETSAHD
jgi:hypothetical protein